MSSPDKRIQAIADGLASLPQSIAEAIAEAAPITTLAYRIANDAVRSDIECYARAAEIKPAHGAPYWAYSLVDANPVCTDGSGPRVTQEDADEDLRIVQRAAEYITRSGNVFPWRMVPVDGHTGWVRFVDKEGRPIRPGVRA